MGRRSVTGGVQPLGRDRIQFDFRIEGVRYRPSLPWIPHESNLRRAREYLARVKACIAAGTFIFSESFPDFPTGKRVPQPLSTRTCGEIFDAFLRHEDARVARGDLAPITVTAHRQILDRYWRPTIGTLSLVAVRYTQLVRIADGHRWSKKTYNNVISALRRAFAFGFEDHPEQHNPARALKSARIGKKDRPKIDPFSIQDAETLIAAIHRDWGVAQGNYDEFRFFTGLRPSEQIALVVSDYDPLNGVFSVTKARVAGVDRDRTKINEDRRVVLCPRARSVLERQLALRDRLVRRGRIHHEHLFFNANGSPIRRLYDVHRRWQRTLKHLAIRYRKPYAARHSSVSWSLMTRSNPLRVAQQHGHSLLTMLTVYAAWTDGSPETDIRAIRRSMRAPAFASRIPAPAATALANSRGQSPRQPTNAKKPENAQRATRAARSARKDWTTDWPTAGRRNDRIAKTNRNLDWRSGRKPQSRISC